MLFIDSRSFDMSESMLKCQYVTKNARNKVRVQYNQEKDVLCIYGVDCIRVLCICLSQSPKSVNASLAWSILGSLTC